MSKVKLCSLCLGILLVLPCLALAAAGTKPTISALSPTSVTAGSATFVLTVGGSGFARGAVVLWNGSSLATTYVGATQLKATVPTTLLTAAGSATITVYIAGRMGGASTGVAFTINAATTTSTTSTTTSPLAISTTSIPGGTAGTAYTATLAATGGTSPYTWSVSSGVLPTGLTLSSTGAIAGTPSTSGSGSFTAQVKDSASNVQTYTYSASIAASTTPTLSVSTASLPSGTAATAYTSTTLAATGGTSPYTWSVASGSTLPAGLTLSTAGALSGTPTTANTYSFSVQVADSASHTATKAYSLAVAAAAASTGSTTLSAYCDSTGTYGPCGSPYETNTTWPPATATPITACGALTPTKGQYYIVKNNLGSDPTQTCLTASWAPSFILDLGGQTVTGSIVIATNSLSGQVIFNGIINCSNSAGCINIQGADTPSAQARIHHIAVNQSATQTFGIYVSWAPAAGATGTPVPGFRMDHIGGSGVAPNQPAVIRTTFIWFSGGYVGVDYDYNYIALPNTAAACQGLVAYEAPKSAIFNNYIVMGDPMNISSDTCRGILLDSEGKFGMAGTGGGSSAYNNTIFSGQNRAIRVRAENGDVIYNNTINDVNLGGRAGAIHIGECDAATESASAEVYGNLFYLNGGNAVAGTGENLVSVYVHDNTVACYNGNCASAGYLAQTDALMSGYNGATVTLKNNNVSALTNAGRASVRICGPGTDPTMVCTINTQPASGTVCNSGNAVGQGSLNLVTTSPCP